MSQEGSEHQQVPSQSAEFDQTERRLGHLLDLGATDQLTEFLRHRSQDLAEAAPERAEISIVNPFHEGIIRPDTEVKQTPLFDGFYLDDPELYQTLATALQETHDSLSDYPPFARDYWAIHSAINSYLGTNYTSHTDNGATIDNNFTVEEDHSIATFKGRENTVCITKAAVVHNFATVLGLKPTLVLGHMTEDPDERSPRDGHAFGILPIPGSNYQGIMDFHVPVAVTKNGEEAINIALFAVRNEQADTIKAGGEIVLDLAKKIHPFPLTGEPKDAYRRYGAAHWKDRIGRAGLDSAK